MQVREEEECRLVIASPTSSSGGNANVMVDGGDDDLDPSHQQTSKNRSWLRQAGLCVATCAIIYFAFMGLMFIILDMSGMLFENIDSGVNPQFRVETISPVSYKFTDTATSWNGNITLRLSDSDQCASFFINSNTTNSGSVTLVYEEKGDEEKGDGEKGEDGRVHGIISQGIIVGLNSDDLLLTVSMNSSGLANQVESSVANALARKRYFGESIPVTLHMECPISVVIGRVSRYSKVTDYRVYVRCSNVNLMCDPNAPLNTPMHCSNAECTTSSDRL